MVSISVPDAEFRLKVLGKLKDDVCKAQRMYFLCQKLGDRVPPPLKKFSYNILNNYTRMAKEVDLKLSLKELIDKILDD